MVFAGGIGENAPPIRTRICAGLGFLGLELDESRNAATAEIISMEASRVTVRPPKPDFAVRSANMTPSVAKGGATSLAVSVDRIDEFTGPITVKIDGLPAGMTCPSVVVQAGQHHAVFGLAAAADAKDPPMDAAPMLIATAMVGGQPLVRQLKLGRPTITEPGDIVTTVLQADVPMTAGRETTIKVKIDRRNGFAGRVPLEVRGLPHGVRVLNIGLNGILITEKESARTIQIFAEPWVEPMTVPIVVLAKREGTNTEHAAPPVPLKIAK